MIEAANEAYQATAAERDDLERQLRDMTIKYEGELMKLEQMKNLVNMMESTLTSHRLERDNAVRENARLEAALTNCFVVLQRHIKGQD
ncbi:MAG: hypothetical protein ABWY82_16195 [Tardiphaga sp.]